MAIRYVSFYNQCQLCYCRLTAITYLLKFKVEKLIVAQLTPQKHCSSKNIQYICTVHAIFSVLLYIYVYTNA